MDANASAPAVEISTRRKSFSEESQEVVMDFHEDDCFDGCNDVGNHQMNHSNADSGVENESDSSRSESIQTENEQMESEGGPSSSNETNVLVINGNEEELSEHEKPGIFIAMDTGDTSDGEQSESSEDEGERNSNEVDDTCRFKGEEISQRRNPKQTMAMTRGMSSPRNLALRCQAPSLCPSNRVLLLLRSTKRKRTQSRVCNSSQSSVNVL